MQRKGECEGVECRHGCAAQSVEHLPIDIAVQQVRRKSRARHPQKLDKRRLTGSVKGLFRRYDNAAKPELIRGFAKAFEHSVGRWLGCTCFAIC